MSLSAYAINLVRIAWLSGYTANLAGLRSIAFFRAGQGRWAKALTSLLVLVIIGAVGILAYLIVTPNVGERFTEFYVLGPEGKAENYPSELALGDQGRVILGIVNREYENIEYNVEVVIDGEKVEEFRAINLVHEEMWEQEVGLTLKRTGQRQKVEFLLYRNRDNEPYQELRLWINVKEASESAGFAAVVL